MTYVVATEHFSGPLQKLLELIEEKELEITSLSLASVTEDFLEFVKKADTVFPEMLADFTSVASKLLLIKSKALLPELKLSAEEENETADLENQLKLYREIRLAGKAISALWRESTGARSRKLFSRPLFWGRQNVFYPGSVDSSGMRDAIAVIFTTLSQNLLAEDSLKITAVSLENKISDLLRRINSSSELSLSAVVSHQSRAEVVVIFLAILHLLKERLVNIRQEKPFDDIIIQKA